MTTSVLLLNASYEPLAVITLRRAVSLMMRGRVEAACDDEVELCGSVLTWRVPTVIRLRYYINVPQRGASWSRPAVLRRDKYTCGYCGVQLGARQGGRVLEKEDFTVDHIVPVSRGGKNSWGNTICACKACNQRKANRLPNEISMKLLWEPKTPRVRYLVASGEVPAAWRTYLEIG